MSSNDALIALAVGMQLWRSMRRGALRRARRRRYRRAGHAGRPQQHLAVEGQPPYGGITPERAQAIRSEAELAARRAAAGQLEEPANPHARGTQEFVLWVTTYHLTRAEIDEVAAAGSTGAVSRHA